MKGLKQGHRTGTQDRDTAVEGRDGALHGPPHEGPGAVGQLGSWAVLLHPSMWRPQPPAAVPPPSHAGASPPPGRCSVHPTICWQQWYTMFCGNNIKKPHHVGSEGHGDVEAGGDGDGALVHVQRRAHAVACSRGEGGVPGFLKPFYLHIAARVSTFPMFYPKLPFN